MREIRFETDLRKDGKCNCNLERMFPLYSGIDSASAGKTSGQDFLGGTEIN